ncbi:hypothetical protein ACFX14_000013 [Malus domestica]
MSKAGYDFVSFSNLGKKNANTVNDKERDLTETKEKLKEHGYEVDNNKAGVGFTPNTPMKISSKAKNVSAQHISVSIEQNQEEPKPAPRILVFDRVNRSKPRILSLDRIGGQDRTSVFKRLNTPTPQSSIFERLSKPKNETPSNLVEKLEETKNPYRKRKITPKQEKLEGLAEKDDVRSSIPSRMKRQATLEVDTKGPLKVRRAPSSTVANLHANKPKGTTLKRRSKISSTSHSKKTNKTKSPRKMSLLPHHSLRMGGKPQLTISRSLT